MVAEAVERTLARRLAWLVAGLVVLRAILSTVAALRYAEGAVAAAYVAVGVASIGCALSLAWRPRQWWWMLGSLAALAVLVHGAQAAQGFTDDATMQHAAMLFGWCAGGLASRWIAPSTEGAGGEHGDWGLRMAALGAIAGIALSYFDAGIAKLHYGEGWVDPSLLRLVIVEHAPLDDPGSLALWVAETPWVAMAGSVFTLVVELAAPLLLLGGRLRTVTALGLVLWHLALFVLTGILFVDGALLLVLLVLGRPRPLRAAARSPA